VREAGRQFDKENEVLEGALDELFRLYSTNDDARHVLLKVVTLNRLYSAGVFAVGVMAEHIFGNHAEIDAALNAGSPDIVDKIARVKVGSKEINCYCFATKYCSWHNPNAYPIYDSRVENYLWALRKTKIFESKSFLSDDSLYDYPVFRQIVIDFRAQFRLEDSTFKQIDKFLWKQDRPEPKSSLLDSFPASDEQVASAVGSAALKSPTD
jgi:hypothetical protein